MNRKTHKTAVVIIPPDELWLPIQSIREKYDRQIRRWMPHITLLYPFRPRDEFEELAEQFASELEGTKPFTVELKEFRYFRHRQQDYTIWLSPEPTESLERLQAALIRVVPDCNDVLRISGRFVPHLSIGQVKGEKPLKELLEQLQVNWPPLSFCVDEVSMIWREDPPDDVFRVGKTIALQMGSRK